MLDELPMLYLALVMVFILLELRPGSRYGRFLPIALVLHGVLVTALSALTRGRLQFFVFHLSFGSLEAFALFRVYLLYRSTTSARVRRLFRLGMSSYLGAVGLWFTDLEFCGFVSVTLPSFGIPNPELHAVWHVLVSFGFYLLVVLIAEERGAALRSSSAPRS
jgi:dihydroceramidase